MSATPPPGYTPPPADLPQRGDRATFSNRVDAWVTWFSTVILTQLAAMIANAYDNAVEAFNQAIAAAASATGAATSATQAQQYAAGAAASAGATVWVSGTTYAQYAAVFDPTPGILRAYRRTTAAGVSTTAPSADPTNWTLELPAQLPSLRVQDRKTSGTAGASLTVSVQNTRELQTVIGSNTITGSSLSANQITLPAGTYEVDGWCTANNTTRAQSNLYNVTDAAVLLIGGTVTATNGALQKIDGKFTIAASKAITLRTQYAAGTGTAGEAASTGLNEVYANIEFKKVA